MKRWVVHGLFISPPDKEETWHELESYGTYDDALLNASRTKQNVIVSGYFAFRIIERTCTDKVVFDSQEINRT